MITVKEILDDLSHGELHGVKLGNSSEESISAGQYPRVISAINIALHKIYTRLHLRERTLKVHQQTGVTRYYLRKGYAGTTAEIADDVDLYLEQTDDIKFEDDVIKVMSAVDSAGEKVFINSSQHPADLYMPDYDVIDKTIPGTTPLNADGSYRSALDVFTITYRARYPKIIVGQNFNPERVRLYTPDFIEQALIIYVAYKIFRKPVKIAKGETSVGNSLLLEYENEMTRLERSNIILEVNEDMDKIKEGGWV